MGKLVVVLNAASGRGATGPLVDRVRKLFNQTPVDIAAVGGLEALDAAIGDALRAGARAIVVGGGDGSVNRAAAALVGGDVPLGVLPLGTLNHFARDAGIPLDLETAASAVLQGRVTRVDAGEVNDRVFLNNVSLGLYPVIVRLRKQHPARGWPKWLVALWATLREARRPQEIAVRIRTGDQVTVHRTPIVLVGNNEYRMAGPEAASRASLQDGLLAIYVVKAGGRRHVLRLAWRLLRRRAQGELDVFRAEAATIEPNRTSLPVAIDGDVSELATPLEFRIRPAALPLLLPGEPTE